jgi:3-hydroxyisobutyrate dehydrogenase
MVVGFLGLGAIGVPMAAHLARRGPLTVWNRTGARAAEFASRYGVRAASTPRDAAAGADVVVTCLPTSREVEALLDGGEGILAGLAKGALFLDCTSGDPATSRRIADRLAQQGVAFADAPVSGGTNGAEAGTLTVMVGGDEETFRRARPILSAFAKRIEHLGPVGTGHAMKAVNNALLAVNILAVGEGLSALVKAGIPARTAVDVLNASSGRSFVSETLVPERVLTGLWPRTFRLALLEKDVGIARGILADAGVPGPVLDLVGQLLSAAQGERGYDAD